MPVSDPSFYDHPVWYDIVHSAGTTAEVDMLERIFRRHGNGGLDWLEPACGTGRYLRVLARRGYRPVGYDINRHALEYARRRQAKTPLGRIGLVEASMAEFRRPQSFDLAFNLINTFRHLLEAQQALGHLRNTARSLRPGGLYILGLDLVHYDKPEHAEEVWDACRGRCRVKQIMMSLPPTRSTRLERIINHLTITTPTRTRYVESSYDLRSYDLAQWQALIRRTPFEVIDAYDFSGKPILIDETTTDLNAVLRVEA